MENNFKRDPATKALINQSVVELEAYKNRKAQSKKVITIEQDINNLKGELEEIKTLLRQLINKE